MGTHPVVRRQTRAVEIGGVRFGGDAPIAAQSMVNTDAAEASRTADQVRLGR